MLGNNKDPEPGSGSFPGVSGPRGYRSALNLELIVHAHEDILDIRFGAEDPAGRPDRADCKARAARAKAHVVIFNKQRPVRYEHPFDAAARRPAGAAVASALVHAAPPCP